MRLYKILISLFSGAFLLLARVQAQTPQQEELEQTGLAFSSAEQDRDWNFAAGGGFSVGPTYEGAKSDRVRPIPLFSLSYRDRVTLGPAGLRVNLLQDDGFRFGPLLGYFNGRSENDDSHLRGLGDIQPSFAAGVFSSYDCGPFEITGTLRQAVTHTNYGLLSTAQLDYRLPKLFGDAVQIVIGPDLDYADALYNRTWFGISPGQSAQSGFSEYSPGAGIKDYGLHGSVTYLLGENLLLRGFASAKQLAGDIADSPVVERRTQSVFGFGIAYRF